MDLYIIRHAWAAERDDQRWPDDGLRPLTEEGKKRFAKVAASLVDRGMKLQVVGASPLVRCRETAQILVAAAGKPKLVELDELRPGSDLEGLLLDRGSGKSTRASPGWAMPPTSTVWPRL